MSVGAIGSSSGSNLAAFQKQLTADEKTLTDDQAKKASDQQLQMDQQAIMLDSTAIAQAQAQKTQGGSPDPRTVDLYL